MLASCRFYTEVNWGPFLQVHLTLSAPAPSCVLLTPRPETPKLHPNLRMLAAVRKIIDRGTYKPRWPDSLQQAHRLPFVLIIGRNFESIISRSLVVGTSLPVQCLASKYTREMSTEGVFLDVIGLSYHCGPIEGTTTEDYAYHYHEGHVVTFSIGTLRLGESIGKPLLTVCDLLPVNTPISDPTLINRARLLYSLTQAQGFEEPITIDTHVGSWTLLYLEKYY